MSHKNLKLTTKSNSNPPNNSEKVTYSRPKFHYIGSLEKVQGSSSGQYVDGSGRYYD